MIGGGSVIPIVIVNEWLENKLHHLQVAYSCFGKHAEMYSELFERITVKVHLRRYIGLEILNSMKRQSQ